MSESKTSLSPAEELKGMLLDIKGSQDAFKEQGEMTKEAIARIEEKVGKHDDILSNLEAKGIPTTRKPEERDLPIPGTNKTTKVLFGYNIDALGKDLQNLATYSDPHNYLKGYTAIADDAKREAFAKYMITCIKASRGNRIAQEQMEGLQVKTNMTEGTDATVGYLVNDEYANEILAFARLTSVALRDCRIMPMGTDIKKIPAESSSVTVAWKTETTAVAQTNPTLAQVTLTAKKLGAYATCTNELLEDSAFDVVSWLSSQFAEALGQEIDNEVFQGDGTGCGVSGLTTAACGYSVTLAGSISTITGTKLSEMITKLGPNKRAGAKFYVNKGVFHYIRTLNLSTTQSLAHRQTPSGGIRYRRLSRCQALTARASQFWYWVI